MLQSPVASQSLRILPPYLFPKVWYFPLIRYPIYNFALVARTIKYGTYLKGEKTITNYQLY